MFYSLLRLRPCAVLSEASFSFGAIAEGPVRELKCAVPRVLTGKKRLVRHGGQSDSFVCARYASEPG